MALEVIIINDEFPHRHHLIEGLSEDGLGVNYNANGDYSLTPKTFIAAPAPNEKWYLSRIVVYVEDTGTFDSGKYGNNVTLVNGFHSWYEQHGEGHILIHPSNPVKTVGDLAANMFQLNHENFGTGNEFIAAPFSFRALGGPVVLDGDDGDTFNVEFRDNQTPLVKHFFTLQGFKTEG